MWDFFKILGGHFFPSPDNAYRPHILRRQWLLFFLAIILTSEAAFVGGLVLQQAALTNLAAVVPAEVIALTNTERAQNNVGQLAENAQLDAAAQNKAEDMATKGYFSHVSPDGTQPWAWILGAGYDYQYAGENLAVRFENSSDVVEAWMASPTHRANIVKPVYTQIGVGVATGTFEGTSAVFVVQYFGTPEVAAGASATVSSTAGLRGGASETAAGAGTSRVAGTSTQDAAAAEKSPSEPLGQQGSGFEENFSAPGSSQNAFQSLTRAAARMDVSASWVLAGVALLIIVALALAFFMHIEIQPADMLLSGAFVAAVALAFLALNHSAAFGPALSASALESAAQGQISIGISAER